MTGVKPPDALVRATALVQSRNDPLRPANEIHPTLGPEIAAILSRAMAQNPEDRFADASEFREALGQVGRTDPSEVRRASQPSDSNSKREKVRETTAPMPTHSASDPFETYSILKPSEQLWLVPKKRHAPNIIAAILVVLLIAGLAGFESYRRWFEEPESGSDFTRTSDQLAGDPTTRRQTKLERSRPNASAVNNVPGAANAESRPTGAQKRAQVRKDGSEANVRRRSPSVAPRPRRVTGDSR